MVCWRITRCLVQWYMVLGGFLDYFYGFDGLLVAGSTNSWFSDGKYQESENQQETG